MLGDIAGKWYRFGLAAALLLGACCGASWAVEVQDLTAAEVAVVDRCGRGALLEVGGQSVLVLAGTPYEMGYQHGYLLRDQVRHLIETVIFVARAAENAQDEYRDAGWTLEQALARTLPHIPERYLREMQGLADGAGIDFEQALLGNSFPELFHCSGFAVMNDATADGRLYHGRILDYMTGIGLQDHAVLMVVKPDDQRAFVSVGYTGFIGTVTAMNERQVAIGEMGGGGLGLWDGCPMALLMRRVVEETDTLDEAVALMRDTPRTCEYYYVVSDGKTADARGLACTPTEFEIVKPGAAHPRLPRATPDAVLLSAGDRYHHLVDRVEARWGNITVEDALAFMDRPVAMTSCLHRVLFVPQDHELYVAHAAPGPQDERSSAAYQPYQRYRWRDYLALAPAATPADVPAVPAAPPLPETAHLRQVPAGPAPTAGQAVVGTVPASLTRPLPPGDTPALRHHLARYQAPPESFEYRMLLTRQTPLYELHEVAFASAITTPTAVNNTVHCEYYRSTAAAPRPAVILLDIMDGSLRVPRLIAHAFASAGIDACIMIMPYYGARRPENLAIEMTDDPQQLLDAVVQAVHDVRRTAAFLAAREDVDAQRIGLCGTSLGGMVGALAAGVDGGFKRVVLVLAGGDLPGLLATNAREVRQLRAYLDEHQVSSETLRAVLAPIEPLTFADRLHSSRVLMLNAEADRIVPAASAQALAEAAGAEIKWFDGDHEGLVRHVMPALQAATAHFAAEKW